MSKILEIKGKTISSGRATICVPVVSSTINSILADAEKCIEKGVSLIEIRADFFEGLTDSDALDELLTGIGLVSKNTIILFTIRTSDEGGQAELSEEEYIQIIRRASRSGHVDLVDCEIAKLSDPKAFFEELHGYGVKIVASNHNFENTYSNDEILDIYSDMYKADADILKLAVMPETKVDTLRVLECALEADEWFADKLIVSIAMGELGKPSRVLSGFVGSCITFASIEKASAPGQLDFETMTDLLHTLEY